MTGVARLNHLICQIHQLVDGDGPTDLIHDLLELVANNVSDEPVLWNQDDTETIVTANRWVNDFSA